MIVRIVGDASYQLSEEHGERIRQLQTSGEADPIQLADQVRRHGTPVASDPPADLVIDDTVAGQPDEEESTKIGGGGLDWTSREPPATARPGAGIRPDVGAKALDDVEPIDDLWF
nr:hypothetical protein [Micromonospora sp. DSM 115978]